MEEWQIVKVYLNNDGLDQSTMIQSGQHRSTQHLRPRPKSIHSRDSNVFVLWLLQADPPFSGYELYRVVCLSTKVVEDTSVNYDHDVA